jgi:hypothetical protein
MTFSVYPEDDARPRPEMDPSQRRRVLLWAAGAVVAILVLAAVGWLVFGDRGSGADQAATGSVTSAPVDTAGPDETAGTDPAVPSSAVASPAAASSPVATGGPGTPVPGLPVSYRVGSDLCPSVDFTPLSGLAGETSGAPAGEQKDYGESGYTDYSCLQRYAQGTANVQAEIFGDPGSTNTWYDTTRANAAGPADVTGTGAAAFDYLLPGNGIETYHLWVRDGNLGFGVTIQVKGARPPGPNTLRAAALNVAKSAMPKLRG